MQTIQLVLKFPKDYPFQYTLGIIQNIIATKGNPNWNISKPMDIQVKYETDYQTDIEEGYFWVTVDYILSDSYDIRGAEWDTIFDIIDDYIEHTNIYLFVGMVK